VLWSAAVVTNTRPRASLGKHMRLTNPLGEQARLGKASGMLAASSCSDGAPPFEAAETT
jgi:hypothetical protein